MNEKKKSSIINFYEKIPKRLLIKNDNPNFNKHHINIPFRGVVNAPSGTGKTNFTLNLLQQFCEGKGTFASCIILTKNSDEPLYNHLREVCEDIQIMEGLHNLPKLHLYDKDKNHMLIIDDLVLEKNQDDLCQYFIMCRKKNVSVLYLAQKFYAVPKVIRDNSNLLVILKIDNEKDAKKIMNEFVTDVPIKTFMNMYKHATDQKLDALLIDKEARDEWRYRRNMDEPLLPSNFI